jgi:hypothetical protein
MTVPPQKANAGRQPGERVNRLIDKHRLKTRASNVKATNSNADLVWWRYAPGICRFQTTRPDLARKLGQRRNARLVMWSVLGPYLRVFEEGIEPWRASKLVNRYLKATNGAFLGRISPQQGRMAPGVSPQRRVMR